MRWAQLSPATLQTHILKWFSETCRVGMKFLCFTTTKSAFSAFYHQVTMFARRAWMAKQCRASFIMWQITRVSNATQIIKHLEGFINISNSIMDCFWFWQRKVKHWVIALTLHEYQGRWQILVSEEWWHFELGWAAGVRSDAHLLHIGSYSASYSWEEHL